MDLNYGADDPDPRKQTHMCLDGPFYLSPSENREVNAKASWEEVQSVCEKYNTEICHFFLEVQYETPGRKGEIEKTIRHCGGVTKDGYPLDIIRARPGHTTRPKDQS